MKRKFSSSNWLPAVCLAVGLMAAVPAVNAQVLTYMFVDGIAGESTDNGHKGWIDLTGYSQSFGTRDCSRVVANKRIDSASPVLISRAASNQLIPNVVITMRKAGEGQRDFFTATLHQVLIDRIELADQDGQLVERVVLAPQVTTIAYKPQDEKGGLGGTITSTVACTPTRR